MFCRFLCGRNGLGGACSLVVCGGGAAGVDVSLVNFTVGQYCSLVV